MYTCQNPDPFIEFNVKLYIKSIEKMIGYKLLFIASKNSVPGLFLAQVIVNLNMLVIQVRNTSYYEAARELGFVLQINTGLRLTNSF